MKTSSHLPFTILIAALATAPFCAHGESSSVRPSATGRFIDTTLAKMIAKPQPLYHLPTDAVTVGDDERGAWRTARQGVSAYLKIADGCRRPCAFCTIPAIKGTMKSRPRELILNEARALGSTGVRELVLIAQDLTDYGSDLGLKTCFAGHH